jgi:hypothetical protein
VPSFHATRNIAKMREQAVPTPSLILFPHPKRLYSDCNNYWTQPKRAEHPWKQTWFPRLHPGNTRPSYIYTEAQTRHDFADWRMKVSYVRRAKRRGNIHNERACVHFFAHN